jgi:YggT family protein
MPEVLANFVWLLATLASFLIFARVILSFLMPRGGGVAVAVIYQLTEPILGPIRRVLPPTGTLDWSPFVALIILWLIRSMVGGF